MGMVNSLSGDTSDCSVTILLSCVNSKTAQPKGLLNWSDSPKPLIRAVLGLVRVGVEEVIVSLHPMVVDCWEAETDVGDKISVRSYVSDPRLPVPSLEFTFSPIFGAPFLIILQTR